ncbi:hypothetical protein G6F40_015043 [Rhizopus arrhizus]|nr:hypothetical protein G6F40_015043 [Rhizopus arrhizus]
MVISAATSDPKRRRGNNVGISMEEDIPMPGPSGTAHVGVPITQPTNHTGVSSVPLTALPGLPNAQELVKKRRKPRKPAKFHRCWPNYGGLDLLGPRSKERPGGWSSYHVCQVKEGGAEW